MEKRFQALRVIATITKIVAWLFLVLGVLGSCVYGAGILLGMTALTSSAGRNATVAGLVGGGIAGAILSVLSILVVVLFTFLPMYAFAQLIDVVLALEENTRATLEQLKSLNKA